MRTKTTIESKDVTIKPMVYSSEEENKTLFKDTYRDFKFYITNGLGDHPNLYIENKFGVTYTNDPVLYSIDFHNGIKDIVIDPCCNYFDITMTWLRISYDALGDFETKIYENIYSSERKREYERNYKKYTTEEIIRDAKHNIDQMWNRHERGMFKNKI